MNIDTNIDNYDLEDMFRLFQVSDNLTNEHLMQMNTTMQTLNNSDTNLDTELLYPEVHTLFKKIFTLLSCLHKYRDYQKIKIPNYQCKKADDNLLITSIKKIPNYENANDVNYLLNKMLSSQTAEFEKENDDRKNKADVDAASASILTPHPVVLDKMVNQIVNTFENKLVAGNINSIKRITKLVNLHLDSCFRDKYYNSNPCNYVYQLPKQFKNVVSMKLASIEIPNAWYLFSHIKKNNTFIIEVTLSGKCSVHNIIIPDGNYNSDTLTAFLNMKYFHQSNTDSPLKYISISVNEYNNKTQFELTSEAPDDMIFSLHFATEGTENMIETCGWILGFRIARYLRIEDMILSEGLFDAGGDRYIYLTVNDYQYNYNETNIICFDKSSMEDYTLAKIPLMNGKFSLIIDENDKNPLVKIRQYNGPVNLSKFEIKVLDKYGSIVDLNFMDFSFSLELEVLYERNNIV